MHSRAIMAGLLELGLEPFAQEGHRLWQINAVKVPAGLDDQEMRTRLLREYNIEIGAGLGPIKGQVWRIGVMGYSANRSNILLVLQAMEDILQDMGHPVKSGAANDAAQAVYHDYDRQNKAKARPKIELQTEPDDENVGESIPSESVAVGVAHRG